MRGHHYTLLACAALTGCAGSTDARASRQPAPEILERAVRIASKGLDDDPDDVQIVEARAETFGSPALGCPKPDRDDLTVETPGHRVLARLRVGDELHVVDVRLSEHLGFVCEREIVELSASAQE